MKVTRFGHASVNVSQRLDACHRFYAEVLGLGTTPRHSAATMIPGFWFVAGETQVHLIDCVDDGAARNPVGPHFALLVEDVVAAVAELERAGIEYVRIGEGRAAQVWISDPAGNTIELGQDPDC
jgi:catechol 2,3-dioxygenase-like lactoylglutathione lyase family enzyme